MTTLRSHARRLPAGVIAFLLLLAACGGSDDPATVLDTVDPAEAPATEVAVSTTTTEPEFTAAEVATDEEEAVPAETASAPADTDAPAPEPEPVETGPAASNLPDCLIGDWIVNDAEMNAYYMTLGQNSGAGLDITADGNMLITLTATDYVFTADYTVNIDAVGQTGSGVATGTASGTWSVEDDIIRSSLVESNLNIDVTVGGVSFDGSDLGNSLLQADPLARTPVSCDGPTLMFQAGATEDIRHPVVLTPV